MTEIYSKIPQKSQKLASKYSNCQIRHLNRKNNQRLALNWRKFNQKSLKLVSKWVSIFQNANFGIWFIKYHHNLLRKSPKCHQILKKGPKIDPKLTKNPSKSVKLHFNSNVIQSHLNWTTIELSVMPGTNAQHSNNHQKKFNKLINIIFGKKMVVLVTMEQMRTCHVTGLNLRLIHSTIQ